MVAAQRRGSGGLAHHLNPGGSLSGDRAAPPTLPLVLGERPSVRRGEKG